MAFMVLKSMYAAWQPCSLGSLHSQALFSQYAALAAPNPPPSSARNHGKSVKADPSLGLGKADVRDVGAKNRVGGCWGYV